MVRTPQVMTERPYVIVRDLTPEDCHWLDGTITKGTLVYHYTGYTYGCISRNGIAVSLVLGETPFFEVPNDSVVPQ